MATTIVMPRPGQIITVFHGDVFAGRRMVAVSSAYTEMIPLGDRVGKFCKFWISELLLDHVLVLEVKPTYREYKGGWGRPWSTVGGYWIRYAINGIVAWSLILKNDEIVVHCETK